MNAYILPLQASSKPFRLSLARWLLYLLILAFPFFSIEPKITRPDWWVGALLILVFGLSVLLRGRLRLDPIGRAALWLHVAVLLSVFVNFWSWQGLQWREFCTLWIQLVFATLLYFALANLKISPEGIRSVFRLWIGVAVIVALYGLYQVLARNFGWPFAYLPYLHPSPERLPSGLAFAGYVRPSSLLREPTYLGMYLLGPTFFSAAIFFTRQDRNWLLRSRHLNAAALTILMLALLASFALAAYLTLGAILLLGLLLNRSLRRPLIRIGSGLLIGLVAFLLVSEALGLPFTQAVEERLIRVASTVLHPGEGPTDPSARTRLFEASFALRVWSHHPLFGVGLNQLQFVGTKYVSDDATPWQVSLAERGYTHNMWLALLTQLGAIGFLFFGLLWVQGLRMMHLVSRPINGKELLRGPALGLFYVLLGTMIRGLFGGPFTFMLYWFYLGLASMVYRLFRRVHGVLAVGQH